MKEALAVSLMFPTVTVTLCDPAAPWNNKHSSLEQIVTYSTLGEGNQRTRNVTFRRGEMQDSRFKTFICYLFVHTQELILQLLKESGQVKKTHKGPSIYSESSENKIKSKVK